MVTEKIIEAAGRAAAAGVTPEAPFRNGPPNEVARLGAAAQLYAVKTKCDCPSCQALRKMADITMSAVLEAGLEAAAAEPVPAAAAAEIPAPEVTEDAPRNDP